MYGDCKQIAILILYAIKCALDNLCYMYIVYIIAYDAINLELS